MYSQKQSENKTLCKVVYQLAKEKNEVLLTKKVSVDYFHINTPKGQFNPIIMLAKEGDIESVDFLINKFHASRDDAVMGYAMGGHQEQVNLQIAAGASRKMAVWAYARVGNVKQVDLQIAHGAERDMAVLGYARGGYVKLVNLHIAKGANAKFAEAGYSHLFAHDSYDEILHLMTTIDDECLKSALVKEAQRKTLSFDVNMLKEEATRLNKLINTYQLSFKGAQFLRTPGMKIWLLQGPQLVREKKILPDLFWIITSMVLDNLSIQTTKCIFNLAHDDLFLKMKIDLTTGLSYFFRSKQATDKMVHEANERFQQRIKF